MSKVKVPRMSESATRSPIELFWTAKNDLSLSRRQEERKILVFAETTAKRGKTAGIMKQVVEQIIAFNSLLRHSSCARFGGFSQTFEKLSIYFLQMVERIIFQGGHPLLEITSRVKLQHPTSAHLPTLCKPQKTLNFPTSVLSP